MVYCHGIPPSGKNTMFFKTFKQRYSGGFLKRKSAIEGTTKPRGGCRYTVYCHGIPLYGKKCYVAFHFDLVFEDVRFSSSSKNPEQHIHALLISKSTSHDSSTYMTK